MLSASRNFTTYIETVVSITNLYHRFYIWDYTALTTATVKKNKIASKEAIRKNGRIYGRKERCPKKCRSVLLKGNGHNKKSAGEMARPDIDFNLGDIASFIVAVDTMNTMAKV